MRNVPIKKCPRLNITLHRSKFTSAIVLGKIEPSYRMYKTY